jgi:hypothetical protein
VQLCCVYLAVRERAEGVSAQSRQREAVADCKVILDSASAWTEDDHGGFNQLALWCGCCRNVCNRLKQASVRYNNNSNN